MSPDGALWIRWRDKRDAEAFRTLADRYAAMVYATALRVLGSPQDAEDIAQECFETLATARNVPGAYIGPWLHRVATNRALNHRRGAVRRTARESAYGDAQPDAAEPNWDDIHHIIDDAIAQLPDPHRRAVVAHFLQGQTHQEVARLEGIGRSTATDRIQKGVELIRETLRNRGIAVPLAALTALLTHNLAAADVPPGLQAALGRIAMSGAGKSAAIGGLAPAMKYGAIFMVLASTIGVGVWWYERYRDTQEDTFRADTDTSAPVADGDVQTTPDTAQQTASPQELDSVAVNEPLLLGRVFDAYTNRGLTGIPLRIEREREIDPSNNRWGEVIDARSTADGSFEVPLSKPGKYRVIPDASALEEPYALVYETTFIWYRGMESPPVIDVPMVPAYVLSGRVVDQNGDPLNNVQVFCLNQGRSFISEMKTASDGGFSVCVPPLYATGLKVSASYRGAVKNQHSSTYMSEGPFDLGPEGKNDVELRIDVGTEVRGQVLKADGKPASRHYVRFEQYEEGQLIADGEGAVTDQSGNFDLYLDQPGSYDVLTFVEGGQVAVARVEAKPEENIEGLVLTLPADALPDSMESHRTSETIRGSVVDPEGNPVYDAMVQGASLGDNDAYETTDEAGRFLLRLREGGPHTLTADHADWSHASVDRVYPGTEGVVITLLPFSSIRLRVTDAAGEPIPNYIVSAMPRGGARVNGREFVAEPSESASNREYSYLELRGNIERRLWRGTLVSAPDGEHTLEGMEVGQCRVLVKADGFAVAQTNATVLPPDSEPSTIDIKLLPEALVQGTVYDPDGVPVPGAVVYLGRKGNETRFLHPNFQERAAQTGLDGRYEIHGLPPVPISLYVEHHPYAMDAIQARLSGGVTTLDVHMRPLCRIEGRVLAAGRPVSGARVWIRPSESGNSQSEETTADGSFAFTGRYSGTCSLSVSHHDEQVSRWLHARLEVEKGENLAIDLDLYPGNGSISGTVTGLTGGQHETRVSAQMDGSTMTLHVGSALGPSGAYQFEGLPPGEYHVSVQEQGTRRQAGQMLRLGQGEAANLDIELQVRK